MFQLLLQVLQMQTELLFRRIAQTAPHHIPHAVERLVMRNPQEIEQLHQTIEVVATHLHHVFPRQMFVHILPVVLFRSFPFGADKQEIHIGMVAQGLAHRLGTLDARTARPTKHPPKIYQDIFAPVLLRAVSYTHLTLPTKLEV